MINLMLGDCLERMNEIEGGSVDMILTDPPYGTTACKWDSIIPLESMWEQLKRIIKPNGAIVITASQPFTSVLIMSNLKGFRYCMVWDKVIHSNPLIAKIQPLTTHEDIVVFYKKKPTYNPQMKQGKEIKRGGKDKGSSETKGETNMTNRSKDSTTARYPNKIIKLSNADKTNIVHPTQKPVALMEYLIKTYTNDGDTVLDFTMGSGSTGVAAKNLNRSFIGIEMDEGYFNIAKDRINKAGCQCKKGSSDCGYCQSKSVN